jgi:hypothetical protein
MRGARSRDVSAEMLDLPEKWRKTRRVAVYGGRNETRMTMRLANAMVYSYSFPQCD